jgi:acetyl esterase/lipase
MPIEIPIPPPPWVRPLPAPVVNARMRSHLDVPFWESPGFRPLTLDIHLPVAAAGPVPLILFIHGGAWLFGTRSVFSPVYLGFTDPFADMVAAGFAVASVDYRMSAEAVWPASLHDVAAGLRFVVDRADGLGIDTSRIAVWGESAGGQLAMQLAFRQDDVSAIGEEGAPVAIPEIAALVDWYGVADIREPMPGFPLPGPSPESRLIGGADPATHPLGVDASPIAHVGRRLPAALIMHGTADSLVPFEGSRRITAELEETGTPVTAVWIEGAEHGWTGTPDVAAQALADTIHWLTATLRP